MAALVGMSMSAQAQYINPSFTSNNTVEADWISFASATGPNDPGSLSVEVGGSASGGTPSNFNVVDNSGGSFITTGGNIYSPALPLQLELTSAFATFTPNNIILQVRSFGGELDPSSLFLVADVDGSSDLQVAPHFTQELDRESSMIVVPDGMGGFQFVDVDSVITAYQWNFEDLTDLGDFSLLDSPEFSIVFNALASSMSLDVVNLDFAGGNFAFEQFVVPEPATGSLVLAGLAFAAWRRRRA